MVTVVRNLAVIPGILLPLPSASGVAGECHITPFTSWCVASQDVVRVAC